MLLASHPKEKYLTLFDHIPPCLTMVTPQSRNEYPTRVLGSAANGNGDDFAKNFRISGYLRMLLFPELSWQSMSRGCCLSRRPCHARSLRTRLPPRQPRRPLFCPIFN